MPKTPEPLARTATVEEAFQWVHNNLTTGVTCPCCTQFAKRYKRKLNHNMVHALVLIYKKLRHKNEWLHVPSYLSERTSGATIRGGDWAKLVHWGLIVGKPDTRADGSKRVGFYKLTDEGRAFVEGNLQVPKYVLIFAERCWGTTGALISLKDAIGSHFDFRELMAS